MVRYLVIFSVVLGLALVMMAGILAQSGYSLFAAEMRMMLIVCVLVAAYVSWRIATIMKRRRENAEDQRMRGHAPSGGGFLGKFSVGGKSKAQLDREARVAARRRKLVSEGKIEAEPADLVPGPLPPEPETEAPTRVSSAATVKEKMAARAERVRKAREEGKI